MNITLNTPLKEVNLSDNIKNVWNKSTDWNPTRYLSREDGLTSLTKLINSGNRVYELFQSLAHYYKKEQFEREYEHNNSKHKSLSIEILKVLTEERLDITEIILENMKQNPHNEGGWAYINFLDLYTEYLKEKKLPLNELILNQLISEKIGEKQYSSYYSIDTEIEQLFNLLNTIPQNSISYPWFSETLNMFCQAYNEDTRMLDDHSHLLNFDSQTKIYDYVKTYFSNHLEDNIKYFSDIVPQEILSVRKYHQSTIEINLYQVLRENNLTQKSFGHAKSVAIECLNIVASKEFMELIHENITVNNINHQEGLKSITLQFSTNTSEELETFEKVFSTALSGILKITEKIHLNWSDSWSGEQELITNMDAKFVHKQYLHQFLNETLELNPQKGRKNKL